MTPDDVARFWQSNQVRPPAPGELMRLSPMHAHVLRSAVERVLAEVEEPKNDPRYYLVATFEAMDKQLHVSEIAKRADEAELEQFGGVASPDTPPGVVVAHAEGDLEALLQLAEEEHQWLLTQAAMHGDGMHSTGIQHNLSIEDEHGNADHVHCTHSLSEHILFLEGLLEHLREVADLQQQFAKTHALIEQMPFEERTYGGPVFERSEFIAWHRETIDEHIRQAQEWADDIDAETLEEYEREETFTPEELRDIKETYAQMREARPGKVTDAYVQRYIDQGFRIIAADDVS